MEELVLWRACYTEARRSTEVLVPIPDGGGAHCRGIFQIPQAYQVGKIIIKSKYPLDKDP